MIRTLLLAALILPSNASEWIPLFNGKDLKGWTPKIAKQALGEDPYRTFRVEDGFLKCEYDAYPAFDGQFGHLFTNFSYSHYLFRFEYKFTGKALPDAPHYVNLNSGIMIHAQPPQSMTLQQGFPVSLEFQFLADEGKGKRPTGNLCTPGTNVEIKGKLITQHIVTSAAQTLDADQWVAIEIEGRGNQEVIHRVNGKEVLRYQKPQIDPAGRIVSTKDLLKAGQGLQLSHGHIAIQAEGQPIWFRKIKIKPLEPLDPLEPLEPLEPEESEAKD